MRNNILLLGVVFVVVVGGGRHERAGAAGAVRPRSRRGALDPCRHLHTLSGEGAVHVRA
ncbi:MAG: hypothetical protein ACO3AQ_08580 [Bacteroidia bacterium]